MNPNPRTVCATDPYGSGRLPPFQVFRGQTRREQSPGPRRRKAQSMLLDKGARAPSQAWLMVTSVPVRL